MGSNDSDGRYLASDTRSVKVVVLGPFGVGKTTLVGAVSEIRPASTEEHMTQAGELVDDLHGLKDKETTTVALDFGRITLGPDIVLYLFGAPGQKRFSRMVDNLMIGALGGVALVDTARVTESWDAIGRLEAAGLPYVVAVNPRTGSPAYSREYLRTALDLDDATPLVVGDVRERQSAKGALVALVKHLLSRPSLEPAP
ncbi:ATP/GTP-binding protein [Streptomyces sp. CFMR 7]|uniref:GTP-binding protein n=1 Tax=Streptomyces sp. CFMR 7 TaxID=1649184 RepID=UPI00119D3750|nr:ATP/GTP-binding protein [Streptomyces sp. CFMR 7]